MKSLIERFQSISSFEIIFSLISSVALGVSYWGWTFIYEICKPFLKILGLQYLTAGFWIFASIFIPFITRRPMLGLAASLMAAYVESLLTQWGLVSLLWGLVQGLGAELVFALFGYRNFSLPVVLLAALVSASFSYTLDFYIYGYGDLALRLNLLQFISFAISSMVIAGISSRYLALRLQAAGVLNQFLIVREK